jgi:L-serine/L-threonine ammonia-lyase
MHVTTPLIRSSALEQITHSRTYLKLENTQPTASFKLRGIGRLCQREAALGSRSFVSSSGGNAGWAVAYAARVLESRAVVVVPETTDLRMRALIAAEGAQVVVHGAAWADADRRARALVVETGASYVPPFDHEEIWHGHSTLVDELAQQIPAPSHIVLSVGGGGLLAGVIEGLERHGWTDTKIIAAETSGAASLTAAYRQGAPVTLERVDTVARNLSAPCVAAGAFEAARRWGVEARVVTDAEAVRASRQFLDDHRMLVEPACGAALSVVYGSEAQLAGASAVVVIVCGGAAITYAELDGYFSRLCLPPS